MKTRAIVIACMVSFAFLSAAPSALAQADKLIDVCKIVEMKYPANPEQTQEARIVPVAQPNIQVFTKEYHIYMAMSKARP